MEDTTVRLSARLLRAYQDPEGLCALLDALERRVYAERGRSLYHGTARLTAEAPPLDRAVARVLAVWRARRSPAVIAAWHATVDGRRGWDG